MKLNFSDAEPRLRDLSIHVRPTQPAELTIALEPKAFREVLLQLLPDQGEKVYLREADGTIKLLVPLTLRIQNHQRRR